MPAYNCGTEVDPFIVRGCKVTLYRVDERANIDVEDIIRRRSDRTRVLYITHYFGWPQNLDDLLPWCRQHGIRLVEDCALALFSNGPEAPLGTRGDAAIFSLGKFLPVPTGGLLTLRPDNDLKPAPLEHWPVRITLQKTVTLLRKDVQRKLEGIGLYSRLRNLKIRKCAGPIETSPSSLSVPANPDMPDHYYLDPDLAEKEIPPVSLGIASEASPAQIITQRRGNFVEMQHSMAAIPGIEPLFDQLAEGTCPMVFPVLSSKRRDIVRYLEARGVCCYPFWEGYHRALDWSEFPEARMLKDTLLTLPVNQSLSVAHMHFILKLLSEATDKIIRCNEDSALYAG